MKTRKKSPKRVVARRASSSTKKRAARHVRKSARAAKLPAKKPPVGVALFPASLALYVYGITEIPKKPLSVTAEAIDGNGVVEPMSEGKYLCWASRVPRQEFAEGLQKNMEDLEWLAACSIRHQKVLAEIGAVTQVLPARFGTVFLTPETLVADLREKEPRLRGIFKKISDADEWGVKVFGTATRQDDSAIEASSGSDYLRRKSEALQGARTKKDQALEDFGEALAKTSAASVAGGKASSGQPGLMWSGSFLVKRAKKGSFDAVLKRFASQWGATRRIDVSGPWPPYSFVNEGQ